MPLGMKALLLRDLIKLVCQRGSDVFRVEGLDVPPPEAAVLNAEHHPVATHQPIPTESDFKDSGGVNRVQAIDPQHERTAISRIEVHVRDSATPLHSLPVFRKKK